MLFLFLIKPGKHASTLSRTQNLYSLGIEASIRTIIVGNIYGIAFDGLMRRLRGKKMKDSKFRYEMGIFFGIFLMIPMAIVQNWVKPHNKERRPGVAPVS